MIGYKESVNKVGSSFTSVGKNKKNLHLQTGKFQNNVPQHKNCEDFEYLKIYSSKETYSIGYNNMPS